MKNSIQNKTEVIQFRLDAKVKKLAKEIADKYFGGNMSDMLRYSLYHFSYVEEGCANSSNDEVKNFTLLSDKDAATIALVHNDYESTNKELSAIGNNINQLTHHVNANAISHPTSPITRDSVVHIKEIASSLKAIRTNNANAYKVIKNYFTKQTS